MNMRFDDGPIDRSVLAETFPGGALIGSASNILPNWRLEVLGKPLTEIGYSTVGNNRFLPPVTVHNEMDGAGQSYGNYLDLASMPDLGLDVAHSDIKLFQTGLVPADAFALRVNDGGYGVFKINGVIVGELSVKNLIAFDISEFRGKEATFEFDFYRGQYASLDLMGFESVPEPSSGDLLIVGILVMGGLVANQRRWLG